MMLIVITVVISVLVSDTMINQVSDFVAPQLISSFGIGLFCLFGVIFGITQYFVLAYAKERISYLYSKSTSTRIMHKIVVLIQYSLLAIVLFLIIQILFSLNYPSYLLVLLTALSYSLNITLMAYFANKFISWYLSNKYSIIVLLYGISFALLAVTSSVGVTMDLYNLSLKPTEIYSTTEPVFLDFEEGTFIYILHVVYQYIDLFSFLFVWGATVLLLHEYIRKWRPRHWVLVCVPLLYYLSTFIDYTGLYTPSSDSEWFSYYLYISLNSTAGGLLFGFGFLIVARNLQNDLVKGYMTLSAYGFVLLFISNQVTLVATSFPPFGTATISYFGLASYMILIGLYASALTVSQDVALRKSIRKSILDQSKLLGSIGEAEMHREIAKWVRKLATIDDKTTLPPSLTEHDVKLYVKEIINKIRIKDN